MKKRACLFQVDMDGLWVITKDCSEGDFNSKRDYVFHSGFEKLLELFDQFQIKATLFVVGKDLMDPCKRRLFLLAKEGGHEFSNHSYSHPKNFRHLPFQDKRNEIERCHKLIQDVLQVTPVGFRAPAYSVDGDVLRILCELEYLYDSSVISSFCSALILFFLNKVGSAATTPAFFAETFSFRQFLRHNRPYFPSMTDVYRKAGQRKIIELPVTCIPFVGIPFHASFVLNSSIFVFKFALMALLFSKVPINYLLHLKDASVDMSQSDLSICSFNPISRKKQEKRIQLLGEILESLCAHEVVLTQEFVRRLI